MVVVWPSVMASSDATALDFFGQSDNVIIDITSLICSKASPRMASKAFSDVLP